MTWKHILKVKALLNKTKRRGIDYIKAVLIYYARRKLYHLELLLIGNLRYDSNFNHYHAAISPKENCLDGTAEYFRNRSRPKFHFIPANIRDVVNCIPKELKAKTIQEADHIINRRFCFRSISPTTLDREIDWRAMPQNNKSWQWDLNRHRFFLNLAAAYHYSGKKKYLDEVVGLWQHWIQKNPPCKSVIWESPLEVALRLNNWIWTFFFLTSSEYLSECPLEMFLRSMYHHAVYLYHNLELHWPNNHLFLESKALLEFTLLFPEYDLEKRMFYRAETIFKSELLAQVLPDGCHSELCTMYHRVVAGELFEFAMLAKRNKMPLYFEAEQKASRMRNFSAALLRSDGSVPLTGDSASDDNSIRFDPEGIGETDLNYWLAGGVPIKHSTVISELDSPLLKIFPQGGYAFILDNKTGQQLHFLYDFGEFSKNPATDHAHCDALSFDLHACGRPLFVDPGVFYQPNGNLWNQYFRSTTAHNTLMIDEREQSQLWRDSDVKKMASVRFLGSSATPSQLTIKASCIPYWGEEEGISHCREIIYNSFGQFKIIDQVAGTGRHKLRWSFHFAPGIKVYAEKASRLLGIDEKGCRLFELEYCIESLLSEEIYGRDHPPLGWYSADSSSIMATYTVLFTMDAELPYGNEFIIRVTNK